MSDASNPHINVLVVDNKKLGNNVHYACSTRNTHILRMTDDESFTENVNGFFYGICFGDHVRLQCLCVLQGGVCDSSWKIVVFSFLFTTCRLYKADTKRNCFAEETSLVVGKAISGWCEIQWFSQREVDLLRHFEHDVDEKWLTTLQHKKVRTRRISGSAPQ